MARIYYRVEAVCEMLELSPAQLRSYERAGLVARVKADRGTHGYSEEELRQLRRIRRLQRDLGLNMAGVEVAVRLLDQIETLQRRLGGR